MNKPLSPMISARYEEASSMHSDQISIKELPSRTNWSMISLIVLQIISIILTAIILFFVVSIFNISNTMKRSL